MNVRLCLCIFMCVKERKHTCRSAHMSSWERKRETLWVCVYLVEREGERACHSIPLGFCGCGPEASVVHWGLNHSNHTVCVHVWVCAKATACLPSSLCIYLHFFIPAHELRWTKRSSSLPRYLKQYAPPNTHTHTHTHTHTLVQLSFILFTYLCISPYERIIWMFFKLN